MHRYLPFLLIAATRLVLGVVNAAICGVVAYFGAILVTIVVMIIISVVNTHDDYRWLPQGAEGRIIEHSIDRVLENDSSWHTARTIGQFMAGLAALQGLCMGLAGKTPSEVANGG